MDRPRLHNQTNSTSTYNLNGNQNYNLAKQMQKNEDRGTGLSFDHNLPKNQSLKVDVKNKKGFNKAIKTYQVDSDIDKSSNSMNDILMPKTYHNSTESQGQTRIDTITVDKPKNIVPVKSVSDTIMPKIKRDKMGLTEE